MTTATPIKVPKLGWSMTEGTLVQWLVNDGDVVEVGTPLYILETDKVENEIESSTAGTVRLLVEPGETYAVGETIAEVDA